MISKAWSATLVDIRQSINYAIYLKSESWIVKRIDGVNYFIKKIFIFGSILKIQRPKKIDFKVIDRLCRKYRVFQIIVEPVSTVHCSLLTDHGFKLSKSPFLPSKTLQIDLTKSKREIYKHFKRNIRKGILMGEKIKIKEYSTPKEIEIFQNSWKKSVKFNRFVPSARQLLNLKKSFPQSKSLFLASHNISGSIIGGVIFTISSHGNQNFVSYYMYGFTSSEGRSTLTHAALLYQGILWGKKMGCKVFDFEGIYDERFPNKSWLGFTQFKKSFGGYEVSYPGAFVKNRFPI